MTLLVVNGDPNKINTQNEQRKSFDCVKTIKISNHHIYIYSEIDCGFCFTHTVIVLDTLWFRKSIVDKILNCNHI